MQPLYTGRRQILLLFFTRVLRDFCGVMQLCQIHVYEHVHDPSTNLNMNINKIRRDPFKTFEKGPTCTRSNQLSSHITLHFVMKGLHVVLCTLHSCVFLVYVFQGQPVNLAGQQSKHHGIQASRDGSSMYM